MAGIGQINPIPQILNSRWAKATVTALISPTASAASMAVMVVPMLAPKRIGKDLEQGEDPGPGERDRQRCRDAGRLDEHGDEQPEEHRPARVLANNVLSKNASTRPITRALSSTTRYRKRTKHDDEGEDQHQPGMTFEQHWPRPSPPGR